VRGVCSAGFSITVFPQLSAGPNFHAVITRGKFHCTDIGQELTVGAHSDNHISLFLLTITTSLMISDYCTLIWKPNVSKTQFHNLYQFSLVCHSPTMLNDLLDGPDFNI